MPEYSREEFSNYSKDQLLNYIEQQKEQMGRLETRFRDVVRAYKGVLKEKEALETTIQALSVGQEECQSTDGGGSDTEGVRSETGDPVRSEGVRSDVSDTGDSGAEGRLETRSLKDHLSPPGDTRLQLKQQLSTLTVAMATLTEEKSKMETSYQQDKKAMLAQQDSLAQTLQTERETAKKDSKNLRQQTEEVREALRAEQRSRQDEQETNAQMMRELQSVITTERDDKEALNVKIEELRDELYNVREQVSKEKVQEYKVLIQSMAIELEQVKGQLTVAERQDPSPQLLKLRQEIEAIKAECDRSVQREQDKVTEVEGRAKLQAQHEEERVASLEAKLSSLSETIGGYDRLRESDLATIQRLKERVSQLDSENTALTKEHIEREGSTVTELSEQVTSLQDKVTRLKALLKLATVKLNEGVVLPANVEELSVSDYTDMLSSQPSGKEYQHELSQLKEEFERYKTRAQSVLRSRGGSKDSESASREVDEVRRVNEQLVKEVESLRGVAEEEQQSHSAQLQILRGEMREMDSRHRREAIAANTQYKNKLQELETEIKSTRSRTLKLMKEKESEIQQLKSELQSLAGGSPMIGRQWSTRSEGSTSSLAEGSNGGVLDDEGQGRASLNLSIRSADSSGALQELLDKSSPALGGRRLLYEVQEQQARDSDLALARQKRAEVEDLNRDLVVREQRHFEQITFLKGEIRKLERDRSRETESMEYLKNIVMHFMCADSTGRDQLINPIATVLHFSPQEVTDVKRKIAARRWLSAAPK